MTADVCSGCSAPIDATRVFLNGQVVRRIGIEEPVRLQHEPGVLDRLKTGRKLSETDIEPRWINRLSVDVDPAATGKAVQRFACFTTELLRRISVLIRGSTAAYFNEILMPLRLAANSRPASTP